MSVLIPTPVLLADLLLSTTVINEMNDGINTQSDQPRTRPVEPVTVQVLDDPWAIANGKDPSIVDPENVDFYPCYWTQEHYCAPSDPATQSEWCRDRKLAVGGDIIAYTGGTFVEYNVGNPLHTVDLITDLQYV
jgi:hypothetical protein